MNFVKLFMRPEQLNGFLPKWEKARAQNYEACIFEARKQYQMISCASIEIGIQEKPGDLIMPIYRAEFMIRGEFWETYGSYLDCHKYRNEWADRYFGKIQKELLKYVQDLERDIQNTETEFTVLPGVPPYLRDEKQRLEIFKRQYENELEGNFDKIIAAHAQIRLLSDDEKSRREVEWYREGTARILRRR